MSHTTDDMLSRTNLVYEQLISLESLPPMPATAARLLTMVFDPDVDIDRLAATIHADPALTAKVLGTANSAYYAPNQPVLTVKQAIIHVLGLRMVGNLALGITLNGALDNRRCRRFDATRYWIMALGTAELSSGLARAATLDDKPDSDAAYLAGLLHSIGELLLVHLQPERMNDVLRRIDDRPELNAVEIEREIIGIDRWAAGAMLCRHWELPSIVADSIDGLAALDAQHVSTPLAHLLSAARQWVEGITLGRTDALHVVGVDEAYCEYRSSSFIEGYDALKGLARNLHA